MKRYISIGVDKELYDKFRFALLSAGETEEKIIIKAIKKYTSESFKNLAAECYISTNRNDISQVKTIKSETHQSWVNLRKAIYKRKNLPYKFGTINVEASADHFLNRVLKETSLSVEDVLRYLNDNKLGYDS